MKGNTFIYITILFICLTQMTCDVANHHEYSVNEKVILPVNESQYQVFINDELVSRVLNNEDARPEFYFEDLFNPRVSFRIIRFGLSWIDASDTVSNHSIQFSTYYNKIPSEREYEIIEIGHIYEGGFNYGEEYINSFGASYFYFNDSVRLEVQELDSSYVRINEFTSSYIRIEFEIQLKRVDISLGEDPGFQTISGEILKYF